MGTQLTGDGDRAQSATERGRKGKLGTGTGRQSQASATEAGGGGRTLARSRTTPGRACPSPAHTLGAWRPRAPGPAP